MTYQLEFITRGSGFFVNETAGENLTSHALVYRDGSGTWKLADADAIASTPVVGITMNAITIGQLGRILLWGFIGLSTWTWTPGGRLYASNTPGELTQTAPIGSGDQVQLVGIAVTATTIHLKPDLYAVTVP